MRWKKKTKQKTSYFSSWYKNSIIRRNLAKHCIIKTIIMTETTKSSLKQQIHDKLDKSECKY